MTAPRRDAGLLAVARVRRVREQDSRTGLLRADRELDEAAAALARLEDALATPVELDGPTAEFVAAREALVALGPRIRSGREQVSVRRTVADAARTHWQADRSRVRAVELLLEHRAEQRRQEALRAEARELDDIAAGLHRRGVRDESGELS